MPPAFVAPVGGLACGGIVRCVKLLNVEPS